MEYIRKQLPKELQNYIDWFKGINNIMNKDNVQYMVDMYWNNVQVSEEYKYEQLN